MDPLNISAAILLSGANKGLGSGLSVGESIGAAADSWTTNVVGTLQTSLMFWPPIHCINWLLVPQRCETCSQGRLAALAISQSLRRALVTFVTFMPPPPKMCCFCFFHPGTVSWASTWGRLSGTPTSRGLFGSPNERRRVGSPARPGSRCSRPKTCRSSRGRPRTLQHQPPQEEEAVLTVPAISAIPAMSAMPAMTAAASTAVAAAAAPAKVPASESAPFGDSSPTAPTKPSAYGRAKPWLPRNPRQFELLRRPWQWSQGAPSLREWREGGGGLRPLRPRLPRLPPPLMLRGGTVPPLLRGLPRGARERRRAAAAAGAAPGQPSPRRPTRASLAPRYCWGPTDAIDPSPTSAARP